MRKNIGKKPWFYPLPVLIIGTYDELGVPAAMNAEISAAANKIKIFRRILPPPPSLKVKISASARAPAEPHPISTP